MAELEKFHSKGMRKKKAAFNIGKQRDSNVYVFNSSLQVYNINNNNNNNNNNNKCLYFARSNTKQTLQRVKYTNHENRTDHLQLLYKTW